MPGEKISALPDATALAAADEFAIVQSGVTKRIRGDELLAYVRSNLPSKIITLTRDLTLASGSVAYTGVGFRPTCLDVHGFISATSRFSRGFVDASRAGQSIADLTSMFEFAAAFSLGTSGADYQTATVTSYDADGFTLAWTKTGAPTGTAKFHVLCS